MLDTRSRCVSSGLLLVVSGTAVGAAAFTAVPAPFLGAWGASPAACAAPRDLDDLALQIDPARVRFHENSGAVVAVIVRGEREISLTLSLSGEGEDWVQAFEYRLSADRMTLSERSGGAVETLRVRCESQPDA